MAKQWHQLEKLDHKALKRLQVEREKQRQLAEKAEEQKRYMAVAAIVLVVFIMMVFFGMTISKRKDELTYQKEREGYYLTTVTEVVGTPEYRKIGLWEPLLDKTEFFDDCSFRTPHENDRVTITTKLGNTIKGMGKTEFLVPRRVLAEKQNEVLQEVVELLNGEITVTVDMAGRDLLDIKVPGAVVVGKSGLFKVLYDSDKDYGEVVVKNGLVEVRSDLGVSTKVSGFYKVVFSSRKVENPVQASVIQYDWR